MFLSRNLLIFRQNKSLSKSELARLIGTSRQNYHEYEAGKVTPRPDKIDALAKALGVKQEDFYVPIAEKSTILVEEPASEYGKLLVLKDKRLAAQDDLIKALERQVEDLKREVKQLRKAANSPEGA